MNRRVAYWKFFSPIEFFTMIFAIVVDSIHKRIPRRLFLAKNIIDYVYLKRGSINTSANELIVNLGSTSYGLRKKGSDFETFDQIVMRNELKRVIELLAKLGKKDLHIVDCGANIGLATIMLKSGFPQARIICVEPEKGNFEQLVRNIQLSKFSDVRPLELGVWHERGMLSADTSFRDGKDWSFALKTAQTDGPKINVSSLVDITKAEQWDHIDYLKIDIEGSEFELFRNLASWKSIFDTVRLVSIEIHEEVGSIFEIIAILSGEGFRLEHHGELLIGIRE
jgi:FkbM family methyltransferase